MSAANPFQIDQKPRPEPELALAEQACVEAPSTASLATPPMHLDGPAIAAPVHPRQVESIIAPQSRIKQNLEESLILILLSLLAHLVLAGGIDWWEHKEARKLEAEPEAISVELVEQPAPTESANETQAAIEPPSPQMGEQDSVRAEPDEPKPPMPALPEIQMVEPQKPEPLANQNPEPQPQTQITQAPQEELQKEMAQPSPQSMESPVPAPVPEPSKSDATLTPLEEPVPEQKELPREPEPVPLPNKPVSIANKPSLPPSLTRPKPDAAEVQFLPQAFRDIATDQEPGLSAQENETYKALVYERLIRAKQYPAAALQRRARGIAIVNFILDSAGQVAGVSLIRSSGDADLDREALTMVRRAAPYPKPPSGAIRLFSPLIEFGSADQAPGARP